MEFNALTPNVESWNLAQDIRLLEALQSFSKNLSSKASTIVEKIDDLSYDIAVADLRLRNTFNEFLMLADSQFIENVSM
jgi:WASH complex subunit FAM21